MSIEQEPNDYHMYSWLSFNSDTLRFYLEAIKFYEALLWEDIQAIETDADLAFLLEERDKSEFEVKKELARVQRARATIEKKIEDGGSDAWDYDLTMSHGSIRFLKSVGLLYLQHLKNRRNILSSKPRISRHALKAVDQKITYFEEKTRIGVFNNATPIPLLVDVQEPEEVVEGHAETAKLETERPRPVVIDSIEIISPELRSRCLDLFQSFKQDGQHERLDTVLTEATRILESKVRSISGAPSTCIGLELAVFAFGGRTPRLIVSQVQAEQESVHLLFRGVFGFIRNHVHHDLIGDLSPDRVLQIVGMIDYLIFLTENATRTETAENGGG
ncbi:MAG: TIGR02391 family protein [Caldilinea sp.]